MNKKLLIDRFLSWPLPESLCSDPCASMPGYPHRTGTNLMTAEHAAAMIEHVIAAPRQSEGDNSENPNLREGLEVVGLQWLGSGHYRKKPPKYGFNPHDWNELCRLSDAQRAIAELRDRLDVMTQCADNYSRMFEESAEECERLRKERDAIAKSQRYGQDAVAISAERDTLRQQLAERDATIERLEAGIPRIQEQSHQMRQQRDKLAGLLAKAQEELDPHRHAVLWGEICVALAEVKPCQESPRPAAT